MFVKYLMTGSRVWLDVCLFLKKKRLIPLSSDHEEKESCLRHVTYWWVSFVRESRSICWPSDCFLVLVTDSGILPPWRHCVGWLSIIFTVYLLHGYTKWLTATGSFGIMNDLEMMSKMMIQCDKSSIQCYKSIMPVYNATAYASVCRNKDPEQSQ